MTRGASARSSSSSVLAGALPLPCLRPRGSTNIGPSPLSNAPHDLLQRSCLDGLPPRPRIRSRLARRLAGWRESRHPILPTGPCLPRSDPARRAWAAQRSGSEEEPIELLTRSRPTGGRGRTSALRPGRPAPEAVVALKENPGFSRIRTRAPGGAALQIRALAAARRSPRRRLAGDTGRGTLRPIERGSLGPAWPVVATRG